MIGFPRWRRVQGSITAREDEERDRRELAAGGGEREHVEEIVVAEDMWCGVGAASHINDRTCRIKESASSDENQADDLDLKEL